MHGPGDDDDDQGPAGRFFLPQDGAGRVLAKKLGYRDGLGRAVGKCKGKKHFI